MGRPLVAISFIFASLVTVSCGTVAQSPPQNTQGVEHLGVEIINTYPFDSTSFTQGLEMEEAGTLLVGTGWTGQSRIYRSTLDGEELVSADLDADFFGEGITRHGDRIWQLTWQAGIAVQRDAHTLEETGRASYPGEGWGLCSDGDSLLMSDGTNELRRLDPLSFAEISRFSVTLDGEPVSQLNELECVDGEVYANVFLSTDIFRIDATSGAVTAVIDASNLPNRAAEDPNHVLNGIAHLPDTDRFLLAGKRWPDLYEVELISANADQ